MNPSIEQYKKLDEYAELANHRIDLLKFYGSEAFKAQQLWLEATRATFGQVALMTGKSVEERERARCMYVCMDQLIRLPAFIGEVLSDPEPAQE